MPISHQDNVAAFAGGHTYWFFPQQMMMGGGAVAAPSEEEFIVTVSLRLALGQVPDNKATVSLGMAENPIKLRLAMADIPLEVY